MNINKNNWGIHAGSKGEAIDLFLNYNLIAVGWERLGDVQGLETREEIKELFIKYYGSGYHYRNKYTIGHAAGTLYRFIYEMKIKDTVIFYSLKDKKYNFAEVIGDYMYQPSIDSKYPNQRQIRLLNRIPRKEITLCIQNSMNAGVALFKLDRCEKEILKFLTG